MGVTTLKLKPNLTTTRFLLEGVSKPYLKDEKNPKRA